MSNENEENEEKSVISHYDTLVLSGGSSTCIVSIGALQYATDNFMLKNVKTYIGTSAGSIICYLIAIGFTPVEIIVYICTHQLLEKIQHFNIVGMINGEGAASFNPIQEQLEKITIDKIGNLLTLKDLQLKFGKTLICVTHNLTTNKTEYLSPENNPTLPCLTALRMSSNLPLIFENYKYNNNIYVDGGVSANFAIDIGDKLGGKVLGILINTQPDNFNNEIDMNVLEYIYKLLHILSSQSTEYKIQLASDNCKIIKLYYSKVKFFNFNIDSKDKLEMFSCGYNQITNILN
jgi:predicted acylesterase/phospholipase RssA